MAWQIIEIIFTVMEAALKIWFITSFLGFKETIAKQKRFIPFCGMIFLQAISVIVMNEIYIFEGLLGFAIYVLLILIYSIIFLKGNLFGKLLLCCSVELFLFVNASVMIIIISTISGENIAETAMRTDYLRIFYLIMGLIVKCFVAFFVIRIKNKKDVFLKKWQLVFFVITFILNIAVMFSCFEILLQISPKGLNIKYFLIIAFGIFLLFCFEIYSVYFVTKQNSKVLEYKLQKMQLEEQKKRMKETDAQYKEISLLRHDFSNYISCAVNLIDSNKPEKAREYLEEMLKTKIQNTVRYVNLGDNAVTSIINIKLFECIKSNIEIKYTITADISKINKMDLSILIANLLDNAIESSKKQEKSQIILNMNNKKNYLCILVKNKISTSVLENNSEMQSDKENVSLHGFGTKSIKSIVDKNNGILKYYEENGFFCCYIMLLEK